MVPWDPLEEEDSGTSSCWVHPLALSAPTDITARCDGKHDSGCMHACPYWWLAPAMSLCVCTAVASSGDVRMHSGGQLPCLSLCVYMAVASSGDVRMHVCMPAPVYEAEWKHDRPLLDLA